MTQVLYECPEMAVCKIQSKYYLRYNVGSHQYVWRQDEITEDEAIQFSKANKTIQQEILINLQEKLKKSYLNPYTQNWKPSEGEAPI